MPSPYYSVVPRNQRPYATPWFQRQYIDTPISIEEELENAISQLVIENDISRVPSSDAIYKYLLNRLQSVILTSDPNIFQEQNTFISPIISPTNIDMTDNSNGEILPNTASIKTYVDTVITNYNPTLSNKYSYISIAPQSSFTISHNLNSDSIIYNLLVLDELDNLYKNDIVSVDELDNNTLLIEASSPINIKLTIIAVNTI